MEIICINDIFTQEQIEKIPNRPKQNSLYSIREIIYYQELQETGFLLNEIHNPYLPHNKMGIDCTFEPTFNSKRFTTLNGESITKEHIKQLQQTIKRETMRLL